jgi:hypothetical protein
VKEGKKNQEGKARDGKIFSGVTSFVKFVHYSSQLYNDIRVVVRSCTTLKPLRFGGSHDCFNEAQIGYDRCFNAGKVTRTR